MALMFSYKRLYPFFVKFWFVSALLIFQYGNSAKAQIDTEFWFVVPELSHRGTTGGTPGVLRFATFELPATVNISMPANPAFTPIEIDILADDDAFVDLTDFIDLPAFPARNELENKALAADGKNNFGLYITATSLISAYWEVNFAGGSDLWVLKGTNALGTLFYTPFQKEAANDNTIMPRLYSAIDVVAIKPNTEVTFTLPPGIGASYGLPRTDVAPGGQLTIMLNRGQTFSLFPFNYDHTIAARLAGTKIEASDSIAVTLKDDGLKSPNSGDSAGDQLVPVSVIGSQYVIPGLGNNSWVYVVATEDGTTISVSYANGTPVAGGSVTLNEGQQGSLSIPPAGGYYRIASVNGEKFYAYHLAPMNKSRGAAVLPAVDACTGNTQVVFSRVRGNQFYLYLLVEDGNEDKFVWDGGVPPAPIIDPAKFTPIVGTDGGGKIWKAYISNSLNTANLPLGQHRISNTGGVFHMGIINGFTGGSGQIYYGYFSDYGNLNVGAFAGGDIAASQVIRACYGSPVNLYAFGGTSYLWKGPIEYLDDPTIPNPVATNLPPGAHVFTVVISGDCGQGEIDIVVIVSNEVIALFQTDIQAGCSPLKEVTVTDRSVNAYEWQFDMGDGSPLIRYDLNDLTPLIPPPPDPLVFQHLYPPNNTDEPVEYTITLMVKNTDGCADIYERTITIYPTISADFDLNPTDGVCDNPVEVTFTNLSFGNTVPNACAVYSDPTFNDYFIWEFGDGQNYTSIDCNETFTHSYFNTHPHDTTYIVRLVAISPYGCRDTIHNSVRVTSYFDPDFVVDKTNGCVDPEIEPFSGLEVMITPNLLQTYAGDINISSILWSIVPNVPGLVFQSDGNAFNIVLPNNTEIPIAYEITLYVENSDGCPKAVSRTVTVYPAVIPDFTFPANPVCNGTEVSFGDLTSPITTPLSTYSWSFGDGAGSNDNVSPVTVTHTYYNVDTDPVDGYILRIYEVKLVVTNPWGCKDSVTHPVQVASLVDADFTVIPAEGCSPLEVTISDNSLGNISDTFLWEYLSAGPNLDSTSTDLLQTNTTYINDGAAFITQTIRFTRTNAYGCFDYQEREVIIYPKVNVSFIPEDILVCDSTLVQFEATVNPDLPNMIHSWSWGDGGSGSGALANHLYRNLTDNEETYDVTLVSTSAYTCLDVATTTVRVSPYIKALFSIDKQEICSGETVTFEYHQMGSITSYSWEIIDYTDNDVNDPGTGTFTKDFFNYTDDPITVTIVLTVSNGNLNCDKTYLRTLVVYPEITIDPLIEISSTDRICAPDYIDFTNPFSGATIFLWDFGDGTQQFYGPGDPVSHLYQNKTPTPIPYTVNVTATNAIGCESSTPASTVVTIYPEVVAMQSYMILDQCDGTELALTNSSLNGHDFIWEFTTSDAGGTNQMVSFPNTNVILTNTHATNTVTYNVNFTATTTWYPETADEHTCSSVVSGNDVLVYPILSLDYLADPNAVCSGNELIFEKGLSNTGGNLNEVTLIWDFGDGNTLSTGFVDQQGHYFVNLEPTDFTTQTTISAVQVATGCIASTAIDVLVHPKVEANFTFTYDDTCTPFDVEFTNVSLNGTDFYWDFGHVNQTGNQTATNPGSPFAWEFDNFDPMAPNDDQTYTIELLAETVHTLTSGLNCSNSTTRPITVAPRLLPSFTIADTVGCSDRIVQFTNGTTGGYSLAYVWDFDDDETSSQVDPNHIFIYLGDPSDPVNGHIDPRTFPVNLTVTNPKGCVRDTTMNVVVFPRVRASFTFDTTGVCTPILANFVNTSLNGSVFEWDYGYEFGGIPQNETTSRPTLTHDYWFRNTTENIETYSINLRAYTDHDWFTATYTCEHNADPRSITVYPELNLNYIDPPAVCSDEEITFVKGPSTGGIASLIWDFRDGNSETTDYVDVPHFYSNTSDVDFVENVIVVATQPNGCVKSQSIPVRVHPRVVSNFTYTISDVCEYPLPVEFTNASAYSTAQTGVTTTFHWNYGYEWLGDWQEETFNETTTSHSYSFYNAEANAISVYDITLTTSQFHNVSGRTCPDDNTKTITVYPELIANFSLSPPAGCNPLDVNYVNSSTGVLQASGGSYLWSFGDGTGSTQPIPPQKTYSHQDKTQSLFYPVNLTVTNPLGCTKVFTRNVEVYPLVVSDFFADITQGCTPLTVNFQNLSTSPAYLYSWNFVYNNMTSSAAQPGSRTFVNVPTAPLSIYEPNVVLTTYLNQLVYPVGGGCPKTDSQVITVYPHIYPEFSGDFEGCHPHSVEFSNATNAFGGLSNATYLWTFGNQVSSSQINPSQTYYNTSFTQDATFPVKLKATSVHGCQDSVSHNVLVHPKPKAKMELLSQYISCPPLEAIFDNQSLGTNLVYHYDFGDGTDSTTTSAADMYHYYGNDDEDEAKPYTITLTTTTEFGCEDFTTQTVYVFPEVHVSFSFDPDAGCNPLTPVITNTSSASAFFYNWDFDDGYFSYLFEPVHRFVNNTPEDRVFEVSLTGISTYDCEDTQVVPLTVYSAPDGDFTIIPPFKVYPDAEFSFINHTSPADPNWTYLWNFGDGYGSEEQHPAPHTYEHWGAADDGFRWWVTLIIDNDKCSDTVIHFLTLMPAEPIVIYTADRYEDCSPLEVYFYNNSMYGDSCLWDFGDGTTSTDWDAYHVFEEPGIYNVSLTVYGDGGVKQFFDTFQVFENPIARFEVLPERVMLPEARVRIFNLSERAVSYIWDLGDGTITDVKNPIHTYKELGEFRITLTAYSEYGCIDIESKYPAVWVEGAGYIKFPNAFVPSPHGPSGGYYDAVDFKNEVFHPYSDGVLEYRLMVFNRWGEQIFQSSDIKVGWDGYYQDKLCDQGVYVWRAVGRFANGKQFDIRGNVTLLR